MKPGDGYSPVKQAPVPVFPAGVELYLLQWIRLHPHKNRKTVIRTKFSLYLHLYFTYPCIQKVTALFAFALALLAYFRSSMLRITGELTPLHSAFYLGSGDPSISPGRSQQKSGVNCSCRCQFRHIHLYQV